MSQTPSPSRVPLAWRNLTENPWRFAASVAGASFAVVLMFSQIGFRNALLDNMVAAITHLDGQLFLVNPSRYILTTPAAFPRERIELARSADGVAGAWPFYVEVNLHTRWRNVTTGTTRPVRLLAFDPDADLLDLPGVRGQREALRSPETALADRRSSRSLFGPMPAGTVSELNGRRVRIAGTFELGTDFRSNGTLVLSEANFLRYEPQRVLAGGIGRTSVDVGVVRVEPGRDLEAVRQAIAALMPADVRVLTRPELEAQEHRFWENAAPIGTVFDIGLLMGFIVGLGICYQVLFSEVADRLAEFATLKAMGYTNGWLVRRIIEMGLYLGIVAYVVGVMVTVVLYRVLQERTGLSMQLRPTSLALVLILTLAMCGLSGLLAGRRLRTADPADLFG
jgi:putative ABC transport system permease protein